VGSQTLTCAICGSGIRGLDLFRTISPGFSLLWLGGWWQVGQRRVYPGGRFLGCGPFQARGLKGWGSCRRLRLVLHGARRSKEAESAIYHSYKSTRAKCLLSNRMQTYRVDFFMTAFFTRIARRGVLVVGGGVSPDGGVVPATAMVTAAEAVGSVSISWRPSRGGEAGGLQMGIVSMQQYWCMTTRQHVHISRTQLLVLFVCAQPGDPAGPQAECRLTPQTVRGSCLYSPPPQLLSPPGGFRLLWTRCRAEPRLLEPSWLRPRRWGGGGPAEGCRVAVGSSSTTLCAPAEHSLF
jgi:hypothetical protein